jgi:hypothetical protein
MALQYQRECLTNGILEMNILNQRLGRDLEAHASDTRPVTTLSKAVRAFAKQVTGTKGDVVFATQLHVPAAMYSMCKQNVQQYVQSHGGTAVYGWSLWSGIYCLEAEYHVIWKSAEGKHYNITPHIDNKTLYEGYFVIDASMADACSAPPNQLLWK